MKPNRFMVVTNDEPRQPDGAGLVDIFEPTLVSGPFHVLSSGCDVFNGQNMIASWRDSKAVWRYCALQTSQTVLVKPITSASFFAAQPLRNVTPGGSVVKSYPIQRVGLNSTLAMWKTGYPYHESLPSCQISMGVARRSLAVPINPNNYFDDYNLALEGQVNINAFNVSGSMTAGLESIYVGATLGGGGGRCHFIGQIRVAAGFVPGNAVYFCLLFASAASVAGNQINEINVSNCAYFGPFSVDATNSLPVPIDCAFAPGSDVTGLVAMAGLTGQRNTADPQVTFAGQLSTVPVGGPVFNSSTVSVAGIEFRRSYAFQGKLGGIQG